MLLCVVYTGAGVDSCVDVGVVVVLLVMMIVMLMAVLVLVLLLSCDVGVGVGVVVWILRLFWCCHAFGCASLYLCYYWC